MQTDGPHFPPIHTIGRDGTRRAVGARTCTRQIKSITESAATSGGPLGAVHGYLVFGITMFGGTSTIAVAAIVFVALW